MSVRTQSNIFVCLDDLVCKKHPYRHFDSLFNFSELSRPIASLYSSQGRRELGAERAFRMLIIQFLEDLSDREMERYMLENNAAKWFCQFELTQKTPDHSFFGDFRKRLGTKHLMDIFSTLREGLKQAGLIREVFTFVDASHLVSKLSTWSDRDKAIEKGLEVFNNETASKVASDKQARFGAKSKKKFWYGYKEHASVDMQSGLINKIAATPANVTDAEGLRHVCPDQGAVYADKGYCTKPALDAIKRKGCHDATLKKNNMKSKNKDKDRWHCGLRSPYERVFSKRDNRLRYRGHAKAQFQVAMAAITHNFKRLLKLGVERVVC